MLEFSLFRDFRNGSGIEQFIDRCIWNWIAMVLEMDVMVSIRAREEYPTVAGRCVGGRGVPVQPVSTVRVAWEEFLEDADALS